MRVCIGGGGRGSTGAAAGVPGAAPTKGTRPGGTGSDLGTRFSHAAAATATAMGTPWAFLGAAGVIVAWALAGPLFHFRDTWQLVINTGTTIVTFLMVFLIQNTQNRDAKAIHLKLDELIRSIKGARNTLIDLEELSEEELDNLQRQFGKLRRRR